MSYLGRNRLSGSRKSVIAIAAAALQQKIADRLIRTLGDEEIEREDNDLDKFHANFLTTTITWAKGLCTLIWGHKIPIIDEGGRKFC